MLVSIVRNRVIKCTNIDTLTRVIQLTIGIKFQSFEFEGTHFCYIEEEWINHRYRSLILILTLVENKPKLLVTMLIKGISTEI